jgi:hypothetical protein
MSQENAGSSAVPERKHPAEEAESRALAPAVLPALAPDRAAPLLHVADQRGCDVEGCEKQQAALEHCGHGSAAVDVPRGARELARY